MISGRLSNNLQIRFDDSPETAKFGLQVKTYELHQLQQTFEAVLDMPSTERENWLSDNEELIQDLTQMYMEDSADLLDGMQLDTEGIKLSIDYVTSLRQVMSTLKALVDKDTTIIG